MIGRLLDRYTLSLWLRLFGLTVLGFPIVSILINLTDSLNKLLDRGLLSPALSMWLPNIILTLAGLCGLVLVNRQPGLNRGGDFREFLDAIRYRIRRTPL